MNDNKFIADLLLPDINTTPDYYESIYPKRELPEGAKVTRFAPSPTGFLHLGSIFGSLVDERLAHQSGGVFYLRIEDTDRRREVEGSMAGDVKGLMSYNILFDEGSVDGYEEKGKYGPYKQSAREAIYKCYIKKLLERGLAYPCFCTHEDLEELRKRQELQKTNTGYYGRWAKHRNITLDEIKKNLKEGKSYVIRLKSPGSPNRRVVFKDMIKGTIDMPENFQDIVILKSDGLPTYHFAHVVDDHLMRTNLIIRGEEWLPSTPIHLQLFDVLGFEKIDYAHTSTLMKMDGNSKRKLSKRKDPELSFSFYDEQGYVPEAVIEYLLHMINSNFEDWRRENFHKAYTDFKVDIDRMTVSGALFDLSKLDDISKDVVSRMSAKEVFDNYIKWAQVYDKEMAELFKKDKAYGIEIFNIEREAEQPRKDIVKWSDVREDLFFFFDSLYYSGDKEFEFPINMDKNSVCEILEKYLLSYSGEDNEEIWFSNLKTFGESLGYASGVKNYKKNPDMYKGHIGDIAMVIRVSLTKKSKTPDLYSIIKILGRDRFKERLKYASEFIKENFLQ